MNEMEFCLESNLDSRNLINIETSTNDNNVCDGSEVEYIGHSIDDISDFGIIRHALLQYSTKCSPDSSLISTAEKMREKLSSVRKIKLNKASESKNSKSKKAKKRQKKQRIAYMDDENIIYITEGKTVVTAYPKDRIFTPNPIYLNKKVGYKYL